GARLVLGHLARGCASILFRRLTPQTVARSAALLRLTAEDLVAAKVVDEVVPEPGGAAHRDPRGAAAGLGRALARHMNTLVHRPARARRPPIRALRSLRRRSPSGLRLQTRAPRATPLAERRTPHKPSTPALPPPTA